jgi:outer membrane protein TolC
MTMPLFDAHKRRDNKSEAGFLIRQNEIKLKELENTVVYERKAALEQLESALGALQVAKENRLLAEKLYSNTKVKFEEANALKTDVLSSSKAVQDARTNYLSALYDLFVAHLNKLKADGKGLVF